LRFRPFWRERRWTHLLQRWVEDHLEMTDRAAVNCAWGWQLVITILTTRNTSAAGRTGPRHSIDLLEEQNYTLSEIQKPGTQVPTGGNFRTQYGEKRRHVSFLIHDLEKSHTALRALDDLKEKLSSSRHLRLQSVRFLASGDGLLLSGRKRPRE
jgi:hypothetical protein